MLCLYKIIHPISFDFVNYKQIAEKVLKKANTPEEMIDALATKSAEDLQMNVFRVENKPRQMRTIFQWALVPSQHIAVIRPIQAKMSLKVSHKDISVKVLDNKEILQKNIAQIQKHLNGNSLYNLFKIIPI